MTEPPPPDEPQKGGLPRIVWLLGAVAVAIAIWAGLFVLVRSIL